MKQIERRVTRMEKKMPVPDCGHKMAFLRDPTEEELERKRKEIDECPQCRKGGKHLIVILKSYRELEAKPQPEVEGFMFEVEEKTAKNGNHKINFTTY